LLLLSSGAVCYLCAALAAESEGNYFMNIKEFADKLNGREYGKEITREEMQLAKELGFVILHGASDDLAEFVGAIYDEAGCCDGGNIYLTAKGLIGELECGCKYAQAIRKQQEATAKKIEAVWNSEGYSWTYKTDIPHATFEIMEDGEKYCRGIVFEKKSLEADAAPEPENTNAVTNVKFKKDWLVEDQDEDVGEDDKLKSISIYECCNCHWIFAGDCERYGYGYTSQSVQTPNYCPMCGAKIKDCID
jgi:rubrerythrin